MAFKKSARVAHKHETTTDRTKRHQRAVQVAQQPKSFISGIHDHQWFNGVPLVLLKEYAEMEAQDRTYQLLGESRG